MGKSPTLSAENYIFASKDEVIKLRGYYVEWIMCEFLIYYDLS